MVVGLPSESSTRPVESVRILSFGASGAFGSIDVAEELPVEDPDDFRSAALRASFAPVPLSLGWLVPAAPVVVCDG